MDLAQRRHGPACAAVPPWPGSSPARPAPAWRGLRAAVSLVALATGVMAARGDAVAQRADQRHEGIATDAGPAAPMGPPEQPVYREGTFQALVGVGAAVGLFLGARALRSRWHRRAGPAGFVSEAVLAVDLMDSTRLATHYGEAVALRARNELEERVRRLTEATRTFLETTGDGCLVTFSAVTPALESAVALVREFSEQPTDLRPRARLEVRVGVTYGEILLDARGVRHGAAINKAYRLLGVKPKDLAELKGDAERTVLPERSRILVDEEAAQEAGRTVGLAFVGYARLRGFTGLHALYEVKWQAGARRMQAAGAVPPARPRGRAASDRGGPQ